MFSKKLARTRRDEFKSGINYNESRTRRHEMQVELRKERTDRDIRRMRGMKEPGVEMTQVQLHATVCAIQNGDRTALEKVRKYLANEDATKTNVDPEIERLLYATLHSIFMNVQDTDIILEVLWILMNLWFQPNKEQSIMSSNMVPCVVHLLMNTVDPQVQKDCLQVIGNVVGESVLIRDHMMVNFPELFSNILRCCYNTTPEIRELAMWVVQNYCSQPTESIVSAALPVISDALRHPSSPNMVIESCNALNMIAANSDFVQAVIDLNVTPIIVSLLSSMNDRIISCCVRLIHKMTQGNDLQTQHVVENGFLSSAMGLMTCASVTIRLAVFRALSNVYAGTSEQIQCAIECGAFDRMVELFAEQPYIVKREIYWCVYAAIDKSTFEHAQYITQNGGLAILCNGIELAMDNDIVYICLHGLFVMLRNGNAIDEDANPYSERVEEEDWLPNIRELQDHPDPEIHQLAEDILRQFFYEDDDDPKYADFQDYDF